MIISINGKIHNISVESDTPLLWVLRDELKLSGTKYGCGIGTCGACMVLVNYEPVRSCTISIKDVQGEVTTIEGLAEKGKLSPVQQAWVDHQVAQCGYCQPGQIIAATALINRNPNPTDEDINESITNICRCGTYQRIRQAIRSIYKNQT
ncbi:MAG: Isoquinoline 1-oxidoreductase subunit alpha [Hyphomicrobiaceae bacterium hypho_1]